jgi:hypothetical protein
MPVPDQGPAAREPQDMKRCWWPDPSAPWGAVLYAVIGGLLVWLLVDVLPHVHVHVSVYWS